MNDLLPHDVMMHCCITPHNAPTHCKWQAPAENARMHEQTRAIIKKLMVENNVSSERQLALDAGMSQPTLNRFMSGKTDSLDYVHLRALAHYFGITVSQLTGETSIYEDRKVLVVTAIMENLPEYKKDMLVAASTALAESESDPPPRVANGR